MKTFILFFVIASLSFMIGSTVYSIYSSRVYTIEQEILHNGSDGVDDAMLCTYVWLHGEIVWSRRDTALTDSTMIKRRQQAQQWIDLMNKNTP